MKKKGWQRLWLAVRWVAVIATTVIIVRVAFRHLDELSNFRFNLTVYWLLPAALATTAANFLLPLGWRYLIIAYGLEIKKSTAIKLWCLAQTGRYLPTGVMAVVTRISLALKLSIPKSVTATSIVVETLFLLAWAALTCALFIPTSTVALGLKWLLGSVALVGLLTLPKMMSGIGAKLTKTNPLKGDLATQFNMHRASALFGASIFARVLGTIAMAFTFLDVSYGDIGLLIGASYAGILVGMVGITPAGIGVRESVLVAVLIAPLGIGDATAFAILSRAWEFSAEMLFLGAASWWEHKKKGSTPETQAT